MLEMDCLSYYLLYEPIVQIYAICQPSLDCMSSVTDIRNTGVRVLDCDPLSVLYCMCAVWWMVLSAMDGGNIFEGTFCTNTGSSCLPLYTGSQKM